MNKKAKYSTTCDPSQSLLSKYSTTCEPVHTAKSPFAELVIIVEIICSGV